MLCKYLNDPPPLPQAKLAWAHLVHCMQADSLGLGCRLALPRRFLPYPQNLWCPCPFQSNGGTTSLTGCLGNLTVLHRTLQLSKQMEHRIVFRPTLV